MRSLKNWRGFALLAGFAMAAMWGCAGSSDTMPAPPPPPAQTGSATYDYTHTVKNGTKGKLSRKLVVALVRFGADRPLDDGSVPYGVGSTTAPATGTPNVVVNVQNSAAQPVSTEFPLVMGLRDQAFLKQKLMESRSFVVVERERILDILRELNFGKTAYVNPETSIRNGDLMGIQYLLEASVGPNLDLTLKNTEAPPPSYKDGEPTLIEKLLRASDMDQRRRYQILRHHVQEELKRQSRQIQNICGVYLSLYSIRTGELAAEAFGIGPNQLMAIEDAVEDLIDRCRDIPNPPRIAAIEGERIFLEVGAADQIKVGQRFRYLSIGKEVRNAAGQIIGRTDECAGELEVTKVDETMSTAKIVRQVSPPVAGAIIEAIE